MNNIVAIAYTTSLLSGIQIKISQNQELDNTEQWLVNLCNTLCYQPKESCPQKVEKVEKVEKVDNIPPCNYGTKVVCIKRKGGEVVQDCDIYIGRTCKRGGWNLDRSKWNNPFSIKSCGSTEEACRRYEQYIRENPFLIEQLPELQGKILGCWCKPNMCHGDILIKLLNEYYPKEESPRLDKASP